MAKQMSAQEANLHAMFAPAGTPESVIKPLNDTLEGVVNDPEVLTVEQ
jgi:tripartite-type tricarboxylate transporter receptor subunit TctC